MKFVEKKGDLFGCPESVSLAHCISEDCRMGKGSFVNYFRCLKHHLSKFSSKKEGIAVLFKNNFQGVEELKDQVANGKKTGSVCVLERGKRFIYYLITKKLYWHKPTYDTMRRSMEAMRDHCIHNDVTQLSMPKIGCGLDGLKWDQVRVILQEVFQFTEVEVTVYYL